MGVDAGHQHRFPGLIWQELKLVQTWALVTSTEVSRVSIGCLYRELKLVHALLVSTEVSRVSTGRVWRQLKLVKVQTLVVSREVWCGCECWSPAQRFPG